MFFVKYTCPYLMVLYPILAMRSASSPLKLQRASNFVVIGMNGVVLYTWGVRHSCEKFSNLYPRSFQRIPDRDRYTPHCFHGRFVADQSCQLSQIHISCDLSWNPVDHFLENIFHKCREHENNFYNSTLVEEKPVACSVNRKYFRDRHWQEKGKNFKHFPVLAQVQMNVMSCYLNWMLKQLSVIAETDSNDCFLYKPAF